MGLRQPWFHPTSKRVIPFIHVSEAMDRDVWEYVKH